MISEHVDEVGIHMTGRVIDDLGADVLAVVEAEDRPLLDRDAGAPRERAGLRMRVLFRCDYCGEHAAHKAETADGLDPTALRLGHVAADRPPRRRPGARVW